MIIVITVLIYFLILLMLSRLTSRKSYNNDAFYRANRKSPWYMVAFGMIGASISGVTFISVPGMVEKTDMTYMQTCIGFIFGYFAVAFILLPVYYKLRLTTIYSYLDSRLGKMSYKTGASFFLLSKMTGAAVRFYVVCIILQKFVLDALNVPFVITV
ncbi:MAG: sodium:solute symporter, partial [Prevotella sp.]|nr:sodium:solute symporter [Prevotella sp.]